MSVNFTEAQTSGRERQLKKLGGVISLKEGYENLSTYRKDTAVGRKAVVVPFATEHGGIEGSASSFGDIQPGEVLTASDNGTGFKNIGEFCVNDRPREIVIDEKRTHMRFSTQEESDPIQQMEKEVGELVVNDTHKKNKKSVKQVPTVSSLVQHTEQVSAKKTIRVGITNKAGTFNGKFLSYRKEPHMLILTYALDADIFTPGSDTETTVKVEVGGTVFEGWFVGTSFSLPEHGIGVQVYLLKD